MASENQAAGAAGATTTTVEAGSLLDQVLTATKQTERSRKRRSRAPSRTRRTSL